MAFSRFSGMWILWILWIKCGRNNVKKCNKRRNNGEYMKKKEIKSIIVEKPERKKLSTELLT